MTFDFELHISKAESALETWRSGRFLLSADDIDAVTWFIDQDNVKKFIQPIQILDQWDRWEELRKQLESLGKEELNQVIQFKDWSKYSLNYKPPKKTTVEQDSEFLRLLFEKDEQAAQEYWDSI